jgi:hypothetical protein
MNFVPEVVTNPVAEGGEDVVVLEVVVLLLVQLDMVLVPELETVLVPTPGRRHWKKKSSGQSMSTQLQTRRAGRIWIKSK